MSPFQKKRRFLDAPLSKFVSKRATIQYKLPSHQGVSQENDLEMLEMANSYNTF